MDLIDSNQDRMKYDTGFGKRENTGTGKIKLRVGIYWHPYEYLVILDSQLIRFILLKLISRKTRILKKN